MRARVAHQLRRRVKAHGLAIDERRAKCRRLVAFQPRGGVNEEREARGVRVVHNEVIGQEIVIAFDLQIVGFSIPGCLDFHDSVPMDGE